MSNAHQLADQALTKVPWLRAPDREAILRELTLAGLTVVDDGPAVCTFVDGTKARDLNVSTLGLVASGNEPEEKDPLAHVEAGDRDPHADDPYPGDCSSRDRDDLYACTRENGHIGQHIAGTGAIVAAVWPA